MSNLKELILSGSDFLTIVISRGEILAEDLAPSLSVLNQLTSDLNVAKYFRERVDISFDGFNSTPEELWEIDKVRNFVIALDEKFPFWTYFLSKDGLGLYVIIKCFLLPFIRPEKQQSINGPKIQEYLTQRAFPAMNYLCELTGVSEEENVEMTNRLIIYLSTNATKNIP